MKITLHSLRLHKISRLFTLLCSLVLGEGRDGKRQKGRDGKGQEGTTRGKGIKLNGRNNKRKKKIVK